MQNIIACTKEFMETHTKDIITYNFKKWLTPKTLLVFTTTFLASYLIIKRRRKRYSITPRWPPGPKPWPLIGNILSLKATKDKRVLYRFQDLADEYGGMVHITIGMGIDIVFLTGTDLIYEAYVDKGDVFSNRPLHIHTVNQDRGILFEHGDAWRKIRNFTMRTLKDLGLGKNSLEVAIQEEAENVVNAWLTQEGAAIDPKITLYSGITNVICLLLFNQRYDYDDEKFRGIVKSIETIFANTGSENYKRSFLPEFIMKYFNVSVTSLLAGINILEESKNEMKAFLRQQVDEHVLDYDEKNLRDFTDYYLKNRTAENKDKIPEENIFTLMCELLGAGSETTTTTLNWMLLYLVRYPDVQEKCRREIHRVIGTSRPPTWTDRRQLPYTEAMILESQRLANILPFSAAHCTSEPVELGGYLLPEKTMVLCNMWSAMTEDLYWTQGEGGGAIEGGGATFLPERWLTDDGSKLKATVPKCYMPFGIGPRACPGENLARMELFLFASTLLQRLRFRTLDEQAPPTLRGIYKSTHVPTPYEVLITSYE